MSSPISDLARNLFWVWQACYSVVGTWASKTSVMPENWTQQHVTWWGLSLHNLNYKITPTGSRTDCNKLCSPQLIIYKTVKNRKWIYLIYWKIQWGLYMETTGQKLKNKIICWSIMCKTSAVTLLNKLTNYSWCLTCLDYTYNGSLDIVVDILSTEFSVSINGMDFFPTDIHGPSVM